MTERKTGIFLFSTQMPSRIKKTMRVCLQSATKQVKAGNQSADLGSSRIVHSHTLENDCSVLMHPVDVTLEGVKEMSS